MITWKYSLSHHDCKQVFISFFPSLSFSLFILISSFPVPRTGFFLGSICPTPITHVIYFLCKG